MPPRSAADAPAPGGPGTLAAVVLAGGRGERLGGADKPALHFRGRTLLRRAVDAATAAGARPVVVVGPAAADPADPPGADNQADADSQPGNAPPSAAGLRWTREDPPHSGPAAAVAAGLTDLRAGDGGGDFAAGTSWVLLLAADLPGVETAVPALLAATRGGGSPPGRSRDPAGTGDADAAATDGWVAVDPAGRRQWLCGLYRRSALDDAVDLLRRNASVPDTHGPDPLAGQSLRALLRPLRPREVPLPAAAVADVDTPHDARRWNIDLPSSAG